MRITREKFQNHGHHRLWRISRYICLQTGNQRPTHKEKFTTIIPKQGEKITHILIATFSLLRRLSLGSSRDPLQRGRNAWWNPKIVSLGDENARKGLNPTSVGQFTALPLVKTVSRSVRTTVTIISLGSLSKESLSSACQPEVDSLHSWQWIGPNL